jgi:ABC-type Fe3+-hydroxamate transport system substrate-binding protein
MPKEDAACAVLEEAQIARCPEFGAGFDFESGELSQEALLALDPDWIIYQSFDPSDVSGAVDDKTWDRLTAVKEGRVFDVDGAYSTGMRGTTWFLPVVARQIWGEDAGVPDPGPLTEYDPAENPLLDQ